MNSLECRFQRRASANGNHWNRVARSPILSLENIEELDLFFCDRDIDRKIPSLRHLAVLSNLGVLHPCSSISMNIRSIIIVLHDWHMPYITGNWSGLRSLSLVYDHCGDSDGVELNDQIPTILLTIPFDYSVKTSKIQTNNRSSNLFRISLRSILMIHYSSHTRSCDSGVQFDD